MKNMKYVLESDRKKMFRNEHQMLEDEIPAVR